MPSDAADFEAFVEQETGSLEELDAELEADPRYTAELERMAPANALRALLVELRSQMNISQSDLAVAAAVPQSTVARIERGGRSPSWDVLYRLVRAVGANLELRLPVERAQRQPGDLEVESAGFRFRTDPDKAGFLRVFNADSGKKVGAAVAWAGSPIVALEEAPNGVLVRTARREGRIARNAKGYWVLVEAWDRAGPLLERSLAADRERTELPEPDTSGAGLVDVDRVTG